MLAGLAPFVALGGPAEAARTLGLKNNSVTSKKIKNRTIATEDLSLPTIRRLRAASRSGASRAARAAPSRRTFSFVSFDTGGD